MTTTAMTRHPHDSRRGRGAKLGALLLVQMVRASSAQAQEPPAAEGAAATPVPGPEAAPAPAPPTADDEVRQALALLEQQIAAVEERALERQPRVTVSGYVDLGFFLPTGDGSGVRRDEGHELFPEHDDVSWVFYGDLLAPTVNSRGEPADLGDLPGITRFDSINSNGQSSFLVNEVHLQTRAAISPRILLTTGINFVPRRGSEFDTGDFFDVDIAQLEWTPVEGGGHSLFAGKFDSVVGLEYRHRKSDQRFGVTPSLVHRYTSGTATGFKARSKLWDGRVILAAALTNGSFGTELFHFNDEIDSNDWKMLSGRAGLKLPLFVGDLEIGFSGQRGTQDRGLDGSGSQWLIGADALLEGTRYSLEAQWLRGKVPGDPVNRAYGLDLRHGAYLQGTLLVTPWLGLLGRAELRDAEVWLGAEPVERLYITRSWRATAGLRLVLSALMTAKIEYLHNGEYGDVPGIDNDVLTSSFVISY
jgi:hypothetical protein